MGLLIGIAVLGCLWAAVNLAGTSTHRVEVARKSEKAARLLALQQCLSEGVADALREEYDKWEISWEYMDME